MTAVAIAFRELHLNKMHWKISITANEQQHLLSDDPMKTARSCIDCKPKT